ncbi:biliverdin-producing heme oxygenase [Sansalvadorimonas sp. 2012CJ34-2]|uniref:Biliverdin-producing heme oxygenase n=1 Tax=Parendozoicomonas callyspongiae TaxID=2942213 RepID=A0ABT0PLA5_9GAMM|nr:biliverdin-producing heme oxygenase [Sansalvadorimonas sp. 2012CJ34-2]MCL6272170.1 biliverdin-producing heme oxygenase [Sansalvadorimonas sp. 2012CJ34-2]
MNNAGTITSSQFSISKIFLPIVFVLTVSSAEGHTKSGTAKSRSSQVVPQQQSEPPSDEHIDTNPPKRRSLRLQGKKDVIYFPSKQRIPKASVPKKTASKKRRVEPAEPETFFCTVIKSARELHGIIAKTAVMSAMTEEKMTREQLTRFHHGLRDYYSTLETVFKQCNLAEFQSFLEEVKRTQILNLDCQFLQPSSPDVIAGVSDLEEIAIYKNHLLSLTENPELMFAHILVRYGSNLFGGQKLKVHLKKIFPDDNLQYYEFGDDANVKRLQEQLKQLVDGIPTTYPASADRFKEEVHKAYEYTTRFYTQLAYPAPVAEEKTSKNRSPEI